MLAPPLAWGHSVIITEALEMQRVFWASVFQLQPTRVQESGGYLEFCLQGRTIAFVTPEVLEGYSHALPQLPTQGASNCILSLQLSPDALTSVVEAFAMEPFGVRCVSPPQRMPWGHTVAFCSTPWGYWLELTDAGQSALPSCI